MFNTSIKTSTKRLQTAQNFLALILFMTMLIDSCWAESPIIKPIELLLGKVNKTDSLLGLPKMQIPVENPLTWAKIKLGKKLFFDPRLSKNDALSCAMCHIPKQGFTNNYMATAVGVNELAGKRNSPTLYNVGYLQHLFHDGRETSLDNQAWGPLLADIEMANPSTEFVVNKISKLDDYKQLFEQAFSAKVSKKNIGMALANYQRSLISANSAFDRWYYGQQKQALSQSAQMGFKLFTGKGKCSSCHLINQEYALFTDDKFHNTGLTQQPAKAKYAFVDNILKSLSIKTPGMSNRKNSIITAEKEDLGVFAVTHKAEDRGKFKTPTLRNIVLTKPYMHNGQFTTLEQVIQHYNQGGYPSTERSALIKPLNLNDKESQALLAFLASLTGDNIKELSQHR